MGGPPQGKAHEGSAVLLVDSDGRVLLQQRDDEVPPMGAGRWAIPGGGREGEEDPRATALREFAEETAVQLARVRHFGTYAPGDDPWMRRFRLHLFIADDDVPRESIQVLEGMDFQYWAPEEARELPVNPVTGRFLEQIFASDLYLQARERRACAERWVSVAALNRWGRALLVAPGEGGRPGRWGLPGVPLAPGQSPDQAAFAGFEAVTGRMLERLSLAEGFRRGGDLALLPSPRLQLYFDDPDLRLADLDLPPGMEARYAGPGELEELLLAGSTRPLLERFFSSPPYKALFH
ncbi:MAG: NUDIX hydrolase [Dehalococcoidia bacterium]|nr:NUDIX hydrolase [Dehalococcoidia bacterium]